MVLQILLAMESDLFWLHLTILHVYLVTAQNDGDVLTHAAQITMPGRHVLVSEARGDVKHDDGALPVDVVPIAKTSKLLLACSIPAVEADLTAVGREIKRVDLNANSGCTNYL